MEISNSNYQTFFVFFFLALALSMKLLAYSVEKSQKRPHNFRFVFLSPLFSTKSYQSLRDPTLTKRLVFLRSCFFGTLMCLYFLSCSELQPQVPSFLFCYLLAPGIYLLTLWIGSLTQLLFSFTGTIFVDIHDRPYLSFSMADFWSRRWNRWIRDWLNNLTLKTKSVNVVAGVLFSFSISGLFHELMFNLPYFIFTGHEYFGSMMAYFILQGLGLLFERKFLRQASPLIRRIFMWVMVIGPSPLFIGPPLLSVIGFNP